MVWILRRIRNKGNYSIFSQLTLRFLLKLPLKSLKYVNNTLWKFFKPLSKGDITSDLSSHDKTFIKPLDQTARHHFQSSPCMRSLACWDTFLQASPSNEKSPCLIFFMISSALVWVRLFPWHWKGTWPDSMVYWKRKNTQIQFLSLNIFMVNQIETVCVVGVTKAMLRAF